MSVLNATSLESLCVIILTHNEELHISRAIQSVSGIANRVIVIDSFSTDATVDLAKQSGAEVFTNEFISHASQFNWALDNVEIMEPWILRLDADEIVTAELQHDLRCFLCSSPSNIAGVALRRRIVFLGKPIMWGGVFPLLVVRLFRNGTGRSEDRLMDEHIRVDGKVIKSLRGELHDINLHPISRWLQKHEKYATLEAIEYFRRENSYEEDESRSLEKSARRKRFLKTEVYSRLPALTKAIIYFVYRYILRLGFLDGRQGYSFHLLQALWYRHVIELKIQELQEYRSLSCRPISEAIGDIYGDEMKSKFERS